MTNKEDNERQEYYSKLEEQLDCTLPNCQFHTSDKQESEETLVFFWEKRQQAYDLNGQGRTMLCLISDYLQKKGV